MKRWRANRFGNPSEVLELIDVDLPPIGDYEFVVRVLASGVGLPDLMMVRGEYPLVANPPVNPGQEIVGEVVEAGRLSRFRIADRVVSTSGFMTGSGGFAELCTCDSRALAMLAPPQLSDEEAAGFLIPFTTAYTALVERAKIQEGETILVLGGAGSSGGAAIQLGRAMGATVLAAAGTSAKVEYCLNQGAHEAFNYRTDSVSERVMEVTSGRGANVVFDPVGGTAHADASLAIARDGRMVLVGFASGDWPELSAQDILTRSYSVVGAFVAGRSDEQVRRTEEELLRLLQRGSIRPQAGRAEFGSGAARANGRLKLRTVLTARFRPLPVTST